MGSVQTVTEIIGDEVATLNLPPADDEVVHGVQWGAAEHLFSPAFWRTRVWLHQLTGELPDFRLGHTLAEELAACLLGGHGIPAEIGVAAFHQLRGTGLLEQRPSAADLEAVLAAPVRVRGRQVKYRFARQKARYLAGALAQIDEVATVCEDHRRFRDQLLLLPGIGPKTASWITRNWLSSNMVAIIDIHIHRACRFVGLFPAGSQPTRDYFALEADFLEFAFALDVEPSLLDALMWTYMRRLGHLLDS